MKSILLTAALAVFSPIAALASPCVGRGCSLDVTLVGVVTSPNPNDSQAVRQAIGDSVTELAVKKYILKATDIYGGWRACVEPANDRGYDILVDKLGRLRTGHDTKFIITEVRRCN